MSSAPAEVIAAAEARAHVVRTGPGGEQVVWRMFGSGPPRVGLRGGFGSWLHWLPVIGHLEPDFRLAVPDMPGFGDSDAIPIGSTPELLADRLTTGIDELFQPHQYVCLAGFSFGGLVAAHVALRIGARVAALGLVASGGLGEEREPIEMRSRRPGMSGPELAEIAAHNVRILMVADPARADALAVEIQQRNTRRRPGLASRPFSRSRTVLDILPRLEAAVAAIWGTKDPTVGPYLDERVAGVRAAVPDAAIAVLEGCGHWIMQERPDALAAFLADTMKRGAPAAMTGEDHQ
jgi:pimeloyl-ACP methyl ester carboxylesterase